MLMPFKVSLCNNEKKVEKSRLELSGGDKTSHTSSIMQAIIGEKKL